MLFRGWLSAAVVVFEGGVVLAPRLGASRVRLPRARSRHVFMTFFERAATLRTFISL